MHEPGPERKKCEQMSFPVLIQGPEAEHRNDYAATDQRWALGQKLVTQDGRTYRFHKVGASTLVVGDLLQGPALITNHLATAGVVDGSTAGSSTVVATLGATASAVDQYRGGYASVVLTLIQGLEVGSVLGHEVDDFRSQSFMCDRFFEDTVRVVANALV